jgi:hypothetical protein
MFPPRKADAIRKRKRDISVELLNQFFDYFNQTKRKVKHCNIEMQ